MANWTKIGEVLSGRDLAADERVTVSVFDGAQEKLLEQHTFTPTADRLSQFIWVQDLCRFINEKSMRIRAGQQTSNLGWEILESGYKNQFYNITTEALSVVTTTARSDNWSTDKRVALHSQENLSAKSVVEVVVSSAAGKTLETIRFSPAADRLTPGLWTKDMAIKINASSLYVRAGSQSGQAITPQADRGLNWIWIPANAGFTVTWTLKRNWVELGEVWSGRDLAADERVTVNVFDGAQEKLLEQHTFTPTADRLSQFIWVQDLCRFVNDKSSRIHAGQETRSGEWEILESGYKNQFYNMTTEALSVVTTTARSDNWSTGKQVALHTQENLSAKSVAEVIVSTAAGKTLETIRFSPAADRLTPGLWTKDMAIKINACSLYVRAGSPSSHAFTPQAERSSNWIWIPANANYKVTWTLKRNWEELGDVMSGRDLAVGERVAISVFDGAQEKLIQQYVFTPAADRRSQFIWVQDLCRSINEKSSLIRAGQETSSGGWEILESGYKNKFYNMTTEALSVVTTTARADNWSTDKRVALHSQENLSAKSVVKLVVSSAAGKSLETIQFSPAADRLTPGLWTKDMAIKINASSLYVRAGSQSGEAIIPEADRSWNWIWIPVNAGFKVTWTLKHNWVELGEVWSGRDLAVGERVTVSVFDGAQEKLLEQYTFTPTADRRSQHLWVMDLCLLINGKSSRIRAGEETSTGDLEVIGSSYRNKFYNLTTQALSVVTTTARSSNWSTGNRVPLHSEQRLLSGYTIWVKVLTAKGNALETLTFNVAPQRGAPGQWLKDLATSINETSLFIRAGQQSDQSIVPTESSTANYIWIPHNAKFTIDWKIAHSWTDLGEVWSGRDLLPGEKVTFSVFDKKLDTLLEQHTFAPPPSQLQTPSWLMAFCRFINARSSLVRAGMLEMAGEWSILESGYRNKYWTFTSRELKIVTTTARWTNWKDATPVQIKSTKTLAAGTTLRVNVRSATGECLETLTFTPDPKRLTSGLWPKDLSIHINNTSLYVRAGKRSGEQFIPWHEDNVNCIWIPYGSGFTVTWSEDTLTDNGKIQADSDAVEGQRISLFVFDDEADKLLDRISLSVKAGRLKKEQWPADLARQINASSGHARAGERSGNTFKPVDSATGNLIAHRRAGLRTFTTAPHLDNWVQGSTLVATADLKAAERIVVTVATAAKGTFCETMTFTPDPARLKAAQWANDLAVHLNKHSQYLKAGVKDTTRKAITPKEDAKTNVIWLPAGSGLTVSWEKTELKALGAISLERDLAATESCRVYVLDDTSEEILREFSFMPKDKRNTKGFAVADLSQRINSQTQLVVVGERKGDAQPVPSDSTSLNQIWACAKNVRAFTTLLSLKNWDKGSVIGEAALSPTDQVSIVVKGAKSGRIFESLLFTPDRERCSLTLWPKDCANLINKELRFVRAGRENSSLRLMEPWHEEGVNYLWTPKESGLVVEAFIISGAPATLPMMTGEMKQQFEQYGDFRKYILVDVKSGAADLQVPIVELYADDSFKDPLKVAFFYNSHLGVAIKLNGGIRTQYDPHVHYESGTSYLTLKDGRKVEVDPQMKPVNGGDFKIKRCWGDFSWKPVNGGDLMVQSHLRGLSPEDLIPADRLEVAYKDGVCEQFRLYEGDLGGQVYRMCKYKAPSGLSLYIDYDVYGRLTGIKNEAEVKLFEVDWEAKKGVSSIFDEFVELPRSMTIFPKSSTEKRTYKFAAPETVVSSEFKFEVDGFATAGKTCCTITTDSRSRLASVEVAQQHGFTEDEKTVTESVSHKESLEYDDKDRVKRYVISPGSGIDDLVHDYSYVDKAVYMSGYFRKKAVRSAAFTRVHDFENNLSVSDDYGTDEVPTSKIQTQEFDSNTKRFISKSQMSMGGAVTDQRSLEIDATGTPMRSRENSQVTYWTYYNNYQQFRVSETSVHVEDWSLFGVLFKGLDYINPIGLGFVIGGKAGLSWGTRLDSTVHMDPAKNTYAKKVFNLPVDIEHMGSEGPFYGDVESELVCRMVDGKEKPVRLTFFGYGTVAGKVRPTHKLTILRPDCTEVDVSKEQRAVATAAASKFVESLNEQIKTSTGKTQDTYKAMLADLNNSLDAQSKVNANGYKLNSWKDSFMSLETYEYHTDEKAAGYGTLKSVTSRRVSGTGDASSLPSKTTTFAYTVDKDDSNLLTIKTTIKGTGGAKDEAEIVSSQTRSRCTGRLYENIDTHGVKTTYTYDPQGNLRSETITRETEELRKTTHSLLPGLVSCYDQVEDGITTRLTRDALGRKKGQELKPTQAGGFLQTHSWTYDSLGRLASSYEIDYGKDNKQVAKRQISNVRDDVSGKCTTTHTLTDATNKTSKVVQEYVPTLKGDRFTQGKFSRERHYNGTKGTLTEHLGLSGSGTCKIERSMTADGRVTAIRHLKVDKAGKETEQDKTTYGYDAYGQLTKATPKLGAASAYTYDAAGRLLTTTRDGVVLENVYSPDVTVLCAAASNLKAGDEEFKLGTQLSDTLGRVRSRTIAGVDTDFKYSGISTRAELKTPGAAPTPLSDYSSKIDKNTRTQVQSLGEGKAARTSTLLFSTSGRVLSFTDLTGATTTYEYDFFERVVRSSNDHCESTFVYADNGLLTRETIKALKAPAVTMTVAYTYDELGQEIKRTFTCDGVDTLTLERTLLADGRLGKSAVKSSKTDKGKVVDTLLYTDSYEYDASLRLSKWTGWSSAQMDCFTADNTSNYTWAYDAFGNVIDRVGPAATTRNIFHHDAKKVGQVSHIYSLAAGATIPTTPPSGARTHDDAGRLTADGPRLLSYHANGQVNTYSMDKNVNKYVFSYDSEGRVRGGTQGKQSDTYHYRGDSVYALEQANGTGFTKRTLVLRNESRACLMQDAITDGKESRSFELRDANGTVIASVDLASKQINWLRYEPYGKRYGGSKAQTWLGFKGEPLMCDRVYYLGNGYRLYDATWGRFLTPDSWSPFGSGGVARYAFGAGDPVNYHDPSGHEIIAQYSRWEGQPAMYSTAFRVVVGFVGVLIAPFTAGTSILLAMATTALAGISFVLDVVSIVLAESDPEASHTLEILGQVFGVASAVVGIGMTVYGLKGLPRLSSLNQVRGGLPTRFPVRFPKTTEDILKSQRLRTQALDNLIEGMEKAKAAGVLEEFKAANLNPGVTGAGGTLVPLSSTLDVPIVKQLAETVRTLFRGVVISADDGIDLLGSTLDVNSGPNVILQKFVPNPNGEVNFTPIVGGPLPGREKLFP